MKKRRHGEAFTEEISVNDILILTIVTFFIVLLIIRTYIVVVMCATVSNPKLEDYTGQNRYCSRNKNMLVRLNLIL